MAVRALHLPSPCVGLVQAVQEAFFLGPPGAADLESAHTCSSSGAILVLGCSCSGLVLNLSATLTACSLAMPSLITSWQSWVLHYDLPPQFLIFHVE